MKAILHRQKHIAIIVLALALTGCLGGQSPPTSFYMLSPLNPSQTGTLAATADGRIRIGLSTVTVPEYLNRSEIVINLDNTVYQLADFSKWAEPLSDNLTRVLEENLTNLLHDDSIDIFLASDSSIRPDYRLEVDVLRLDGNLGDQVTLVALWALLAAEEDDLIVMRRSEYQASAADNTYKELVMAKSLTIEKLSQDIALNVKTALGN